MSVSTRDTMPDDRLDRLIAQALADRADDVASEAVPAGTMTDLIARRLPQGAGGFMTLRMVVVLAVAAMLIVASLAIALIGSQPRDSSILPGGQTPNPSPTASPTPVPAPVDPQTAWDIGAISDVCSLAFQDLLAAELGVRIRADAQTPPERPEGSVCQLWDADYVDRYIGNIHVFEPPPNADARADAMLDGTRDVVKQTIGSTPVFMTTCDTQNCNGVLIVAGDRYLVVFLTVLPGMHARDAMAILERIAQTTVNALDDLEVGS